MSEGKTATLPEIPLADITDASTKSETVAVRVTRRNAKGQLQAIPGWSHYVIPTLDLVNIEQTLREQAGGGQYRIEAKNPQDLTQYLVQPFYVNLEGMPKPAAPADFSTPAPAYPGLVAQPGAHPPPGGMPYFPQVQQPPMQMPPMPAQPPDAWGAGLSPAARAAYYSGYYVPQQHQQESAPAPGASVPSDQMALRQIGDLKAEVAALKKERDNLVEKIDEERERYAAETAKTREKYEAQIVERDKKIEKILADARDERHRMEMEAIRAEMRASTQLAQQPKESGIAQYAPLIIAWLDSSSKREQAQQQSQSTLLTTLLTQKPQKDDSMAAMMPFMLEMARQKSPEAQAAVMSQLMDSQMSQLGMQAQIIQMMMESQGQDNSPWAPLLQQGMGSMMELFGAYLDERRKRSAAAMTGGPTLVQRGLPPTTMPNGGPPQVQPAPAPVVAPQQPVQARAPVQSSFPPGASYVNATGETTSTQPAQPARPKPPAPMPPEQIVQMILATPKVPASFKTPEWQGIMLRIHRRDPVEQTGALVVAHVTSLASAGALPEDIARIFDDPGQVVTDLLTALPIAQYDLPYATALRDNIALTIIEMLKQANATQATASPAPGPGEDEGDDEGDEDEEGDEEEGEEDEATAAPPAAPSNGHGVIDAMNLSPSRR